MTPWYRSKTLIANAAVLVLAHVFDRSTVYVNPLGFVWAIAAVNIGLRLVTRGPISWPGARRGGRRNDGAIR